MKKLFKFLVLLNAIISLLAVCPDRPTIPSGSIPSSNPIVLTSTSPGISHFPSSTKQFSLTMSISRDDDCQTGSTYNLFSMSLAPSGGSSKEDFTISISCDIYGNRVAVTTDWTTELEHVPVTTYDGLISMFFSIDLDAKIMKFEIQGEDSKSTGQAILTTSGPSFDGNTKFYLCAGKDGASPSACTFSELIFEYRYYDFYDLIWGHLAGTYPEIAGFYPLLDGSLAPSFGSASDAYFGDKKLSPTTGTSPTWDSSSNGLVIISTGQFLTFPLPSYLPGLQTNAISFSFAAWVKITNIPATTSTIFSMHSTSGSQVAFKLSVSQSTKALVMTFKNEKVRKGAASYPVVSLDTWQLIGFTTYSFKNERSLQGTIFVDSTYNQYTIDDGNTDGVDFAGASVIRIGGKSDSIEGQVSVVRMMTPGGGVIRSTDLCSSANNIELGVSSFALTCATNHVLSSVDNKCYASCPSGTREVTPFTDAPTPLCVSCARHCKSCDDKQCLACETGFVLYSENQKCILEILDEIAKSGGLSAGAIAGIVCGSVVLLAIAAWVVYCLLLKKPLIPCISASSQAPYVEAKTPVAPQTAKTPVSPVCTEDNPFMP